MRLHFFFALCSLSLLGRKQGCVKHDLPLQGRQQCVKRIDLPKLQCFQPAYWARLSVGAHDSALEPRISDIPYPIFVILVINDSLVIVSFAPSCGILVKPTIESSCLVFDSCPSMTPFSCCCQDQKGTQVTCFGESDHKSCGSECRWKHSGSEVFCTQLDHISN